MSSLPRRPKRFGLSALLLVPLLAALVACDKPIAVGSVSNVLVAAPDSVWDALRPAIEASLEPRTFTVRDERIFEVGHVDPTAPEWGRLQNVRQVLVIGEPADPWVAAALQEVSGTVPSPPAVVQAQDVWAQNQLVTVLLLPPASGPAAAGPLVEEAGGILVSQLEDYARARMYISGIDSVLADSLRNNAGFVLMLPDLYRPREVRPGVYEFRNDNPDPATMIRAIEVDSRPNGEVELTAEAALQWRGELAASTTEPAQETDPVLASTRRLTIDGRQALEIQGVWANPPGDWPAAGPFIARLVQCDDRTYLVDGWVYAPGRPKYEYLVQIGTMLDSFRCA